VTGHEVILVRHGQTEWSLSGKHTGHTDIPLTDLGRRQADALGGMLGAAEFALVLSSPLIRAWETMERAGYAGAGSDGLLEWDYGVYEGERTADIRTEIPDWSVWVWLSRTMLSTIRTTPGFAAAFLKGPLGGNEQVDEFTAGRGKPRVGPRAWFVGRAHTTTPIPGRFRRTLRKRRGAGGRPPTKARPVARC
jgi:hypothetical protein